MGLGRYSVSLTQARAQTTAQDDDFHQRMRAGLYRKPEGRRRKGELAFVVQASACSRAYRRAPGVAPLTHVPGQPEGRTTNGTSSHPSDGHPACLAGRGFAWSPDAHSYRHPAEWCPSPGQLLRRDASSHRTPASGDAYYFIADYHSHDVADGPGAASRVFQDVALDFLACGLDPKRCVFWRQSDVPSVTELAWMLSTVTLMGLLERATSYKDKMANLAEGDIEKVNHGLFAYPVLMAADILCLTECGAVGGIRSSTWK